LGAFKQHFLSLSKVLDWQLSPGNPLCALYPLSLSFKHFSGSGRGHISQLGAGFPVTEDEIREFGYLSKQGNFHWIKRQKDGQWNEVSTSGIKVGTNGFTVLSSNSVAWQKGNKVWSMNLTTRAATVLCESPKPLTDFSYSRETAQLLLSCSENGEDTLLSLNLSQVADQCGRIGSFFVVAWQLPETSWSPQRGGRLLREGC
jgi:hypothetical protein